MQHFEAETEIQVTEIDNTITSSSIIFEAGIGVEEVEQFVDPSLDFISLVGEADSQDNSVDQIIPGMINDEMRLNPEDVYQRFLKPVRYILRNAGCPERDLDDMYQVTMLKVFSKLELYNNERGSFFNWVLSVAANSYRDEQRKIISRPILLDVDDETSSLIFENLTSGNNETEDAGINSVAIDQIYNTIDLLSPNQANVVRLTIQGYTQSEIAAKLGIPLGTVKTRIRLGYGNLKGIDVFKKYFDEYTSIF